MTEEKVWREVVPTPPRIDWSRVAQSLRRYANSSDRRNASLLLSLAAAIEDGLS